MGKEQVNMADTSELSLSNASNEKFWPNGWWKLFDLKVGIIPLPLFVLAAALIAGLCIRHSAANLGINYLIESTE